MYWLKMVSQLELSVLLELSALYIYQGFDDDASVSLICPGQMRTCYSGETNCNHW